MKSKISTPILLELVMLLHNATSLLNKEQNLQSANGLLQESFTPTGNIMFGTGICNRSHLSVGVPIDILTYFLVAKLLQENIPNIFIYNVLADAHAEENGFLTDEIKKVADNYEEQLNAIANALKIKHFHILRSTQYCQDQRYVEILDALAHIPNTYIRRQLADVKYLADNYSVDKKIGWGSKNRTAFSMDELFFDNTFKDFYPDLKLWFLYVEPGKRLSNKGMDAIPYTTVPSDMNRRVMFDNNKITDFINEIDEETCSKQNKAAYRNYLKKIARLYTSLFPNSFTSSQWEYKIDSLNELIFKLTNNENQRSFTF